MNFEFVLFFVILMIMQNVCHSTNTFLKPAMFTVDGSLRGFVCIGNFVLEGCVKGSVLECASLCKKSDECDGFFHHQGNKTCVMCSDPFDDDETEGLADMEGTQFYRRNECNGIVRGFDGKEIVGYSEIISREDAQATCKASHGQLVQIREPSQMRHLSDAVKSCSETIQNFWTDGVFNSLSGAYLYSDGTAIPMGSADFWGDPNFTTGNGCINLQKQTSDNYRWDDTPCESEHKFICEI